MNEIDNLMQSLNKVMTSAQNGERTAQQVSKSLTDMAATMRKLSDQMVMLSRQLVGNNSTEPAGRKTVVLKNDEDTKTYKKAKASKQGLSKAPQRGYAGWTPERRMKQAERMRKLHADMKEARNKKSLLNTATISEEQ